MYEMPYAVDPGISGYGTAGAAAVLFCKLFIGDTRKTTFAGCDKGCFIIQIYRSFTG